jgi:hypothetical protein
MFLESFTFPKQLTKSVKANIKCLKTRLLRSIRGKEVNIHAVSAPALNGLSYFQVDDEAIV